MPLPSGAWMKMKTKLVSPLVLVETVSPHRLLLALVLLDEVAQVDRALLPVLVDRENKGFPLLRLQLDLTDQLELRQVVRVLELLHLFFPLPISGPPGFSAQPRFPCPACLPILADFFFFFFFSLSPGLAWPGTWLPESSVFIRPTLPALPSARTVQSETKTQLLEVICFLYGT